jgi:hypothetical protein
VRPLRVSHRDRRQSSVPRLLSSRQKRPDGRRMPSGTFVALRKGRNQPAVGVCPAIPSQSILQAKSADFGKPPRA